NELRHLEGVRPGLHDPLLGAPQLRGGHELHRARDLLCRLDGADPPTDVLEGRHRRYAALMPRAATNSAFAARISSSSRPAARSRYWARSRRSRPAIWRMALICAAPPTRETESPTFTAGRTPA